jgi:hypothetical protein
MINLHPLLSLMEQKGVFAIPRRPIDLAGFLPLGTGPDVEEYFLHLLPEDTYFASGVRVRSLKGIIAENAPSTAPGGFLYPYGYIVIATSIGGNAVCVDHRTGATYWADHDGFTSDEVHFEDRTTGQWMDLPINPETVAKALVPLESSLEVFLTKLLTDRLTEHLDSLD